MVKSFCKLKCTEILFEGILENNRSFILLNSILSNSFFLRYGLKRNTFLATNILHFKAFNMYCITGTLHSQNAFIKDTHQIILR